MPAALQMGVLRRIFGARERWWLLVPDQSALATGGQTDRRILTLSARHERGKWIMVHLEEPGTSSANTGRLRLPAVKACRIEPGTGDGTPFGAFGSRGIRSSTTAQRMEDTMLVIEREE